MEYWGSDGIEVGSALRADLVTFAAGRTMVGARFIVHSLCGGRGEATPLPPAALRRPKQKGRLGEPSLPSPILETPDSILSLYSISSAPKPPRR